MSFQANQQYYGETIYAHLEISLRTWVVEDT